jgi:hypothetical protein
MNSVNISSAAASTMLNKLPAARRDALYHRAAE